MNNNTYIQILIQSLMQKEKTLDNLINLTKEQEKVLDDPNIDTENFLELIERKEKSIKKLDEIDIGFNHVYDKVKEELSLNKNQYKEEVFQIQNFIKRISELSMELQAKEKANKSKLEAFITLKRNHIKNFKKSKLTTSKYYNKQNNMNENQSYFFDSKK